MGNDIDKWREAIAINPNDEIAWNNLGNHLIKLDRLFEAEKAYLKVIKINPRSDYAWNNLGILLHLLKRFNEAEKAFTKALEIDHLYDSAWNNLGALLKDLKRYEKAEEAFREAIGINPENEKAWVNMGLLQEDINKPNEAQKAFRRVVEINPGNESAWNYLGILLEDLELHDEAEEAFKRVKELNPENTTALTYLDDLKKLKEEKDAKLSIAILKTLQQVRQNISFQLSRLAQLVDSTIEQTESKVIEILSLHPELGEYLPLEQVFIKHAEISESTISKFSRPTDTLQKCPKCGSRQSVLIRHCTQCKIELSSCQICKRGFAENEITVTCSHCNNKFHKNHLLEYIKIKGECPVCKEKLGSDEY